MFSLHDNDIHCSRTHLTQIPGPVKRHSFFTRLSLFAHACDCACAYREGSGHQTRSQAFSLLYRNVKRKFIRVTFEPCAMVGEGQSLLAALFLHPTHVRYGVVVHSQSHEIVRNEPSEILFLLTCMVCCQLNYRTLYALLFQKKTGYLVQSYQICSSCLL